MSEIDQDKTEGLVNYADMFGAKIQHQLQDLPSIQERIQAETRAAAVGKQRNRKRIRTVQINFRTTASIKGMLEELSEIESKPRSAVIDQAIIELHQKRRGAA